MKLGDQTMVARVRSRANRLESPTTVHMCDGRQDRLLVGPNRIDLLHERIGRPVDEVIVQFLLENRRSKRAKLLTKLDLRVDQITHVGSPRVGQYAPVAKSPGSPLHAALK